LKESGIRERLLLCNAMHITAGVFINDDEQGLHADFERWLEQIAPEKPHNQYDRNRTGEDNADAHLKRIIIRARSRRRGFRLNTNGLQPTPNGSQPMAKGFHLATNDRPRPVGRRSNLTGVVRLHLTLVNASAGTVQFQASKGSGGGTVTLNANSDFVARRTG
jgi:hypothetical protein